MPITEADRLRRMLGERIPPGGSEADTFFTDEEITDILATHNGNLNAAATEGWYAKAAELSVLIDTDESGSLRKLSMRFKQAFQMMTYFGKLADIDIKAIQSSFRVTARVVNLDESTKTDVPGTVFSGYSDHIRLYPLKRFNAILSAKHLP